METASKAEQPVAGSSGDSEEETYCRHVFWDQRIESLLAHVIQKMLPI